MPVCKYCGGTKFYEGPGGGAAQNLLCANEDCRHWFNYVLGELQDLERVEPTKEEQQAEKIEWDQKAMLGKLATWGEGRLAFMQRKTARECVTSTNHNGLGFYGAAGDDLMRLAGWLDAFADSLKPADSAGVPQGQKPDTQVGR